MLTIRLLGELEVVRGIKRLVLPPSKKTRALLAYLAVTGRPHRRERLCELLWDVPDDPRGALRWSLSKIRDLIDEPGSTRIVADREIVAFAAGGAEIDLLDLRKLVRRGLKAAPIADLVEAEEWFAVPCSKVSICQRTWPSKLGCWLSGRRPDVRQLPLCAHWWSASPTAPKGRWRMRDLGWISSLTTRRPGRVWFVCCSSLIDAMKHDSTMMLGFGCLRMRARHHRVFLALSGVKQDHPSGPQLSYWRSSQRSI